jgi:hypothetical protein
MRRYQAIWEELKSTKICTISADPTMHLRIKAMVIKEKYRDKRYKKLRAGEGLPPEVLITSFGTEDKHIVQFRLMTMEQAMVSGMTRKKYRYLSI